MSKDNTPLRDMREVMRDEMVMKDKIIAFVQDGEKSVPEIAQELGCPTHEVMYWVMAMRRYGKLVEVGRPDDDGYFKYKVVSEAS